jgi:hypothetical protein
LDSFAITKAAEKGHELAALPRHRATAPPPRSTAASVSAARADGHA